MVEKLQATETLRRKWRWPMVILAGGHIVAAIYLLAKVANFPDEPPERKRSFFRIMSLLFC